MAGTWFFVVFSLLLLQVFADQCQAGADFQGSKRSAALLQVSQVQAARSAILAAPESLAGAAQHPLALLLFQSYSRTSPSEKAGHEADKLPRLAQFSHAIMPGGPAPPLIAAAVVIGVVVLASAMVACSNGLACWASATDASKHEPSKAARTPEADSAEGSCSESEPQPEPPSVAATGELARAGCHQQPLLARAATGLLVALAYIAISAAMILYNKYLMREDIFPFAAFLTSLHMMGALVFGLLLRQIAPSMFPSCSTVFSGNLVTALVPFLPIGFASTVALVAGNWAYRYATVTFLQMVKESHIVIVYGLMVLFGLEALRLRYVVVLILVACCATLAVYGETQLSMTGLLLQLVAGSAGSMQIVLTNRLMTKTGSSRVDPLTMVLCMAPITLLTLGPANMLFWDPRIPRRLVEWWPALLLSVILAFALQVCMAVAIRILGGTGLSMSSVAKDLSIVFSAAFVLNEHVSQVQWFGFLGSVTGIAVYSFLKLAASTSNKA